MVSTTSSNSGVHSESASSRSQPPVKEEQDVSSENVIAEKSKKESLEDQLEEMDMVREEEQAMERQREFQEQKKYEKYVAEYTRFLKAKYFADKTIFGGNIYDVKMTSDGQTVKASRLPPYQSFADPASFHAMTNASKPEEETVAETSNGKQTAKKSN